MSRQATGGQVRPQGSSGANSDLLGWGICIVLALAGVVFAAVFVGGRVASAVTGHGFRGPAFKAGPGDLAHPQLGWPGVPQTAVGVASIVVGLLILAVVAVPVLALRRVGRRPRPASRSMARPADVATLHTSRAGQKAYQLRPELQAAYPKLRSLPAHQRGVTVGKLLPAGGLLQASFEDCILAIFAPRSGKTTALAVPMVLDAPGAVVSCSNKSDVYLATAAIRELTTSEKVWVLDPQQIAHVAQTWWWNPLGGRMSMNDAVRLAGGFVMAVSDDSDREIWGPAANELLSNLFYAAHLGGRSILDAYGWLFDEATEEPVQLLREHGHVAAAHSLAGIQGLHPETRGSVYFTARSGCSSLRDNDISRWVTPQPGLPEFSPRQFVNTRETLYLLSKSVKGGTSAAALVSTLTTEVRVAAERAGERRGGRIDPPLLLVLDEVANICRIPDLPEQYSHMGSRSIVCIAILQSYAQGERVWGKAAMKELWGASTIKLVGAGADDVDFAEDISRIIGEHDVNVLSYNRGQNGSGSSTSTRRERIMSAADVRAMPKNQAVLLATGIKPALISLLPWHAGPRKGEVAAAAAKASASLMARARAGDVDAASAASALDGAA